MGTYCGELYNGSAYGFGFWHGDYGDSNIGYWKLDKAHGYGR